MKRWNVLIDKEIIHLIIGDLKVTDDFLIEYKMPYMSGSDICEFGRKVGLNINYFPTEKKSRIEYMKNVLEYVVKSNKINLFFRELFELKRFRKVYNREYYKSNNALYFDLIHGLIDNINDILFFDKCHIEYSLETYQFALIDDEENIRIESNNIKKLISNILKD